MWLAVAENRRRDIALWGILRQNGAWFPQRLIIHGRNDCRPSVAPMETPRGCARRGERESQRDKRQEEKEKESERGMRTEGEEGSLFELYYKTNIFQVLWGITIVFWKGLPARAARRSGSRAKLQYSATITTPGWYIISYNFSSLSRLCLAPLNEDKRIGKETWLRIPSPLNLRFIFPLPDPLVPFCSQDTVLSLSTMRLPFPFGEMNGRTCEVRRSPPPLVPFQLNN